VPSADQARLAAGEHPIRSPIFLKYALHAAGSSVVLAVWGAPPGTRTSRPEATFKTWKPTYGLVPPISSRVKATRRPSGAQAKLTACPQNTLCGQRQTVVSLSPRTDTMCATPFAGVMKSVSGPFRTFLFAAVAR